MRRQLRNSVIGAWSKRSRADYDRRHVGRPVTYAPSRIACLPWSPSFSAAQRRRPPSSPLLAGLEAAERALVERALEFAAPLYDGKLLGTGEPALEHAYGLAANLAQLRIDATTRAAGLLFAVPEYLPEASERLAERFDPAVAALVGGVARLNRLRVVTRGLAAAGAKGQHPQAENLRKMLLAMVEDIRVVLIRLASRTQTLRFLGTAPDDLRAAARARDARPLRAARQPARRLAAEVGARGPVVPLPRARALQADRARCSTSGAPSASRSSPRRIAVLERELAAAGIAAEVTGRPKHIYSICNKMQQKGLDFDEVYDVRAAARPGRRR